MTPFGERLRALREERGMSAKEMAAQLNLSPAYLSALEHGHRGKPNRRLVHSVCQLLGLIWDDADALQRLADLSHPKVTVDTSGLTASHTLLANRLAERVRDLTEEEARALAEHLDGGQES